MPEYRNLGWSNDNYVELSSGRCRSASAECVDWISSLPKFAIMYARFDDIRARCGYHLSTNGNGRLPRRVQSPEQCRLNGNRFRQWKDTSTTTTITLLAGDIDGDFTINQFDALTIGMNYNTSFPVSADLNNDGIINALDLELLAKNYRKIGPILW